MKKFLIMCGATLLMSAITVSGATAKTVKKPKVSATQSQGMTTRQGYGSGNAAMGGNNGNSAQGSNAAQNIKGGNSGSGR